MFGFIEGKLEGLTPTHVYIRSGAIGYEILLTLNTYEAIQNKKESKLYLHLQIKEDAWSLFGFATEEEREAFRKLITVSGIGAATARLLLSSLNPAQLFQIVESGDSKTLQKVKGIGAKTSQRIILELKGKLPNAGDSELLLSSHNTLASDALNALLGLGIARSAAENAIKKSKKLLSDDDGYTVEDLVKTALKNL